jgi:hypothetical protein
MFFGSKEGRRLGLIALGDVVQSVWKGAIQRNMMGLPPYRIDQIDFLHANLHQA